jgi:hypothetical protein
MQKTWETGKEEHIKPIKKKEIQKNIGKEIKKNGSSN